MAEGGSYILEIIGMVAIFVLTIGLIAVLMIKYKLSLLNPWDNLGKLRSKHCGKCGSSVSKTDKVCKKCGAGFK